MLLTPARCQGAADGDDAAAEELVAATLGLLVNWPEPLALGLAVGWYMVALAPTLG